MKRMLRCTFMLLPVLFFSAIKSHAQTVLLDFNFQTSPLPAGLSSDGTLSPTKAADGVCSKGMIQVNGPTSSTTGNYLQADIASCETFTLNMKSTSTSTRTVNVKYKRDGDASYASAGAALSVQPAASFVLTDLFPVLKSNVPISIRIEPASGNIQVHDVYATGSTSLSSAAEITQFKLPGQIGTEVINSAAGTIALNVPMGTPLTSVAPSVVTLSAQATVTPAATAAQNFNNDVVYTVTAQNGNQKSWTVHVTQMASSAKEITSFQLSANQIGSAVINSAAGTVLVTMPQLISLSNLVPVSLTLSANATVNPSATTARDFSQPVTYTVTAQDLSTKTWTINVTQVDPNAVFTTYEAEEALFTGKVDNSHLNYTGTGFIDFLSTGENSIIFTVCQKQAGNQTVKFRYSMAKDEVRQGQLYINDVFVKTVDFPRTATFDDWLEEVATVSLQQGINTIKLTWETTDGPNLDRMDLTGAPCTTYSLATSSTNGGIITVSPARSGNKFFEGETVTLLAESKPNLLFQNWSGDVLGSENPVHVVMNSNKSVTGNFTPVATYKLTVTVSGIGQVDLSPAGGEYTAGTVVTLTPKTVLGSTFTGWSGALSGNAAPQTITMTADKSVTASFTSSYTFNWNKPVGFASVTTASYPNFNGPTTGGLNSKDTLWINGPAEFDKLATTLYDRIKAYKNKADNGLAKYAPLTVMLKEGTYTMSNVSTSATTFANYMLTVQEQGDLTIMGEKNVVLKFGINIKRSWNILIRNITFQDYYDDGINIGEPETHHIWVDHCTVGNPTTMPADHEHPDGGIDIKTGASYVTISFCKYRNSWKTGLVGHSDSNGGEDLGKLFVTYFANWFYHTNSRNPRVRFGQVHVLNNLEEEVQLYGIAAANTAQVYAEGNFFLNTDWPMYADRTVADFKAVYGNNSDDTYTSKTGNYPAKGLKQVNNAYDDSGLPVITAMINPTMLNPGGRSVKFDEFNPGQVFTPSNYYTYDALDAQAVRVIVPLFAGADKVNFNGPVNAPLPLNFLSFNATLSASKNTVNVNWKTANEEKTNGFDVQRSSNGKDYISIGLVASHNRVGSNDYSFTDAAPLRGVSFYRLKQVDQDGRFKFSAVVPVNNLGVAQLSAYPNPAKNNLAVLHENALSGARFEFISMDGKVSLSVPAVSGTSLTNINVSLLSKGNYLLRFKNGAASSTTRFVKQ